MYKIMIAVLSADDIISGNDVANNTGSLNSLNSILQLVAILAIFFVVLFLAYYVTKLIGGSGFGGRKGKNIDIIESRPVSTTSGIQLVRVGTGYFLIGVTKENITFLSEIDRNSLDLGADALSHQTPVAPFEKVFRKYFKPVGDINENKPDSKDE